MKGLLILVLAQVYLGALVAGLRAGYAYNTWPLIDGALIPDGAQLLFETPLWRNFFENILRCSSITACLLTRSLSPLLCIHSMSRAGCAQTGGAAGARSRRSPPSCCSSRSAS